MREEYLEHIRKRFATARVAAHPFPHLVLEDVLPLALYEAMEHDSPSEGRWTLAAMLATLAAIKSIGTRRRMSNTVLSQPVISLNDRKGTAALRRSSARWKNRYYAYVNFIHQQVVELFKEHSRKYLDQLIGWELYPSNTEFIALEYEFCYRTKGWMIPPHTHTLSQTLQWMLYFPLPGSTENHGTQLYHVARQKQVATKDLFGTTWFTETGETELALSVPYRRNVLICFLNTPKSVHGSVHIPDAPARRYLFVGEWFDKSHNPAGPGRLTVSDQDFIFEQ